MKWPLAACCPRRKRAVSQFERVVGDAPADHHGVIRFQHRRKISSILIRNTLVPIAIRTTRGSCGDRARQITENPEWL
jgi:hypothetical protein